MALTNPGIKACVKCIISRALILILLAAALFGVFSQYYYIFDANSLKSYREISSNHTEIEWATFNDTQPRVSYLHHETLADYDDVACKFPKVDPFEPSVMALAGLNAPTISCEGKYLPDLTFIQDRHIFVNKTLVADTIGWARLKHCKYRFLLRSVPTDENYRLSVWSEGFREKAKLELDAEFLLVDCVDGSDKVVSRSYFALVPRHSELDEQFDLLIKKRKVDSAPKETLNVIMVCLDSLPRNQFLRALNKTYGYLMNSLESFDFTMHSQLGINTFPNFVPLSTGRSLEETRRWWNNEQIMDSFDLFWHSFSRAGYRTLYTEDTPRWGAFHYLNKGFAESLALYNSRPLFLAMEEDQQVWTKKHLCVGNQVVANFHLDYVMRFLDTYKEKPVLALALITKFTHDYLTWTKFIDLHLYNFLKSLERKGHLNKSLLIFFSDHGIRWGKLRDSVNGIWESRMPYLYMTLPKWFLQKYPEVARNLRTNTKRLTTHLDTHATLRDLLYFRSQYPPPLSPLRHGISLFDPVPKTRTCKDVPVPKYFCLCGASISDLFNNTDTLTSKLAKRVLEELNHRVDLNICSLLQLKKVIHVLKFNRDKKSTQFLVQVQTYPGNGIFEASVLARNNLTEFSVGKEIDRQNVYQGQSDCVTQAEMRPFCYCKNLINDLV